MAGNVFWTQTMIPQSRVSRAIIRILYKTDRTIAHAQKYFRAWVKDGWFSPFADAHRIRNYFRALYRDYERRLYR